MVWLVSRAHSNLRRGLLALGVAAVLTAVLAAPGHAEDPLWSPPDGYVLDDTDGYSIPNENRCEPGTQWVWSATDAQVGLILVPCETAVAAQAAANAQVLFSDQQPDQQALGVEVVTWDADGVALRVWTQEEQIVVLGVTTSDGDRDAALALGAELAPSVAASLPGEPAAPAADGASVQGILVAAPLAIWLLLVLPARAVIAWRRPRYSTTSADPRWRDVTAAVAVLRARRRWRIAGRWVSGLGLVMAGFGVANLALTDLAPAESVARIAVGVGAVVGGIAMIRKNAAHPTERAGRPPSTHGLRAWAGTAISVVAHLLAAAVLVAYAMAAVTSVIIPPSDVDMASLGQLVGADPTWRSLLVALGVLVRDALLPMLLVLVLTLVAIAGLDALGRRLRAASLREVLVRDPRPPILYLRSFDEDRLTLPATLHRRGLMDTLNVVRRRRFEEAVVVQLQRAGPVVAIAPPGVRLPKVGAARASYSHDEWQDKVSELAQRAAVVVLSATPDSVREGFGWEIDLVANRLRHRRVMVVVGPWRSQLTRRWEAFRAYVAERPFFAELATAELPDGLLLAAHSDRWGWCAWGATTRSDFSYAVAIDHALHAWGEELMVDDDPDAIDPLLVRA